MNTDISIVIPFLNEEENLESLVDKINNYFSKMTEIKAEVIFVDDGSTDKSVELLEKCNHKFYSTKIIQLSKNFGSHAATRAGIFYADAEVVTFMSADLQEPIEIIGELYKKIKEGNDIAFVTKDSTQVGFFEKIFSKLYSKLMKKYAIPDYPEQGLHNIMFNKKVKEELNANIESNSSLGLQILSLGFKKASISCCLNKRNAGKSKWTLGKKIKLFIDSFVAFSYAPIRCVSLIGIVFALFGFLGAIYTVIVKLFIQKDMPIGWPTLITIIMIGFGITNISLGIIAEYLWRTLDSARNRKSFIVDKITSLNNDI